MYRYPPTRCSVSMVALTLAAFTRDQASNASHTLIPPRRTKAIPSVILKEGLSMLGCQADIDELEVARLRAEFTTSSIRIAIEIDSMMRRKRGCSPSVLSQ